MEQEKSITAVERSDQLLVGILSADNQQLHLLEQGVSVRIENFNMPFMALVGLLVKIALASIPAAIVFSFALFLISMIFSIFVVGGLGSLLGN